MNHYDCNGPCSLGCTWNALQPSQLYPLPPAEQCSELWLRKCAGFARAAALRLAQTGGLGLGQPRLPRRSRLPWAGPCPPAPLWWGPSVLAVLGMCSPRAPKLARVCGLCPDSSGAACDRVLPRLGPARLGAVRREPWDSSHLCFSPSVIESSVPSAAVGQVAAGRPQEDRGAGSDGWVDGGLQGRTDGRLGGGTAAWRRALLPGEGPGAGGCDPRSPPPPRSAPLTRCPSRRASSIASPPPAPPCLTSPAPGRWGAARISTSSSKRWVSSGRRAGWGNEPMEGAPGSRSSAVPGAPGRARGCGTGKSASPARGSRGRAGCALLLTCKGRRSCPGAQPPCFARSRGFSARGCSAAFPPPAPSRTGAGWAWRPQALLPSRFAQVSTPCSGRWRWRPPPNPTWRSARTGTSSTSKLPPLSAPRKSTSKSGRASRRRRWMAENAG